MIHKQKFVKKTIKSAFLLSLNSAVIQNVCCLVSALTAIKSTQQIGISF